MHITGGKNWIWMALCLALSLLALASCGGGVPIDLNGEAATNASSTPGDVDLIGEAYSAAVLDEPVLPKDASDLQIMPVEEAEMTEQGFSDMHVSLHEGHNGVEIGDYLAASADVAPGTVLGPPVWHMDGEGNLVYGPREYDAVNLTSTPGNVSFVTYGFKDIPEDKEITGLLITGLSDAELSNPGAGLYVGIGDYESGAYRWYGPLGTKSKYELTFRDLDSTNDQQRGYITLAVYGGDIYNLIGLNLSVSDRIVPPEIGNLDLVEAK